MEADHLEVIFLELKYCEQCGGLWFRREGEMRVYCKSCSGQWPESRRARRESDASLPVQRRLVSDRRMIDFLMICPPEGEA